MIKKMDLFYSKCEISITRIDNFKTILKSYKLLSYSIPWISSNFIYRYFLLCISNNYRE